MISQATDREEKPTGHSSQDASPLKSISVPEDPLVPIWPTGDIGVTLCADAKSQTRRGVGAKVCASVPPRSRIVR